VTLRFLFLLVILLSGCSPGQKDPGGTAVGNPGEARLTMGENDDFTWTNAWANLDSLTAIDCEGNEEVVDLGEEFSFLDEDVLPLPAGTFCEFDLRFDGALTVQGETSPTTTFTMELDIPDDIATLYTETGLQIDETASIFEVSSPNVLTVEELDLEEDTENTLTPTMGVSIQFASTVAYRSSLWLDDDEDGALSDEERDEGPLSAGDEWVPEEEDEEEEADTDNGCGGGGGENWLLLFVSPLLFRRRH